VQALRFGDVWIVRWIDVDRALPYGAAETATKRRRDCAACWRPRSGAPKWSAREIAALPSPIMWSWCAACVVVTWYASIPTQRSRFTERAS
jgi:hypothetical protein